MKLNLSGHKNSALNDLGFQFPGTIHLDMDKSFQDNLESVVSFLKENGVDSDSNITVALPGMNILATMVIIGIHGITGSFPNVVILKRDDEGNFNPDEEVDLQKMRNHVVRNLRDEVINL